WQDLHHDEAVALWQKLPAAVREGPELTKRPTLPGVRVISGRITSVGCDEKAQTMTVKIDDTSRAFQTKGESIKFGLSDTVWFGADHFNRCLHLEGLRGVIQYKPSSVPGITGTLGEFEIYDDDLMAR